MKADTAKAMIRARAGEMPMDWAATSLPWMARRVRPKVPPRSWITTTATTVNTMRHSARKVLPLLKSNGPSSGRGTWVPCRVLPPPTHENFTTTASKKKAKARVAMANQTPPRRRTG